jgi:pimeloyl-ACP methyl ester carboxylesterase
MKSQHITGGAGTRLHVVEAGNPLGPPIVFIHGFSQCWRAWSRQLDSDLAADHRLVAMDMRGHGLSDKPTEAYADSKLWADDVHAVIQDLKLNQPILCGWSYGSLVFLDYVRHYGDGAVGGLHFVGGISKLGSEEALAVLTPEFLALVPGLLSPDTGVSTPALEALARLCFVQPLAQQELAAMLEDSVAVPSYVRQSLFARSSDNDDLLPMIRKPVLITHGADEAIVRGSIVGQHSTRIPHAEVHLMPGTGHAPFWEDAAAFNRRLRAFAASAAGV